MKTQRRTGDVCLVFLLFALIFLSGCASLVPEYHNNEQAFALKCAWCSREIANGKYDVTNKGNVMKTVWERPDWTGVGSEGQGVIVGNTSQGSPDAIIRRDLASNAVEHNGSFFCSPRCVEEAQKK